MPRSHPEGRDWAVERIAATTAPIVIDIGCGEGTYSDLARGWRPNALWVGVEIWEPYVTQFDLWDKYDVIAIRDARQLTLPTTPFVLLVGDVLEHMPRHDSTTFLTNAKQHAEAIMVSIPIVDYPQHHHDNPFEEHVDQWTFDDMAAQLPGSDTWSGEVLGRYWWTPTEDTTRVPDHPF